jgi:hypothetical protein
VAAPQEYERRDSTVVTPAPSPRKHFSPAISIGHGDIPICYDDDDDDDKGEFAAHGALWKGRRCFTG